MQNLKSKLIQHKTTSILYQINLKSTKLQQKFMERAKYYMLKNSTYETVHICEVQYKAYHIQ